MSTGTGLDLLSRELPDQFYDVGIAEGHATTFAAGLATEKYRPVVAIYSTFLQRAFDHIVHDVCLQNLPVTFLIDRAGLVGEDGPTHHGTFDISYLRNIPNMTVMAPRDENILRHMIYTGIYSDRPCAIRYPRGSGLGVTIDKTIKTIPLGTAEKVFGDDASEVLIIAVGNCVHPSIEAAKILYKEGIKVTVIDARFIKPLDENLLFTCSKKISKWITVEENMISGGFGSAINEFLTRNSIKSVHLITLGLPDKFIEQGPQNLLRSRYGIDSTGIANAVKNLRDTAKEFAEDGNGDNKKIFDSLETLV
jgi:1-deoxy-D-xylulose-5-phosphate synthase